MTNLIFILYQVIVIIAVIHVIMDNRQPAKTMAWALVIYFIPVAGVLAYIFLGVNTRRERYVSKRSMDQLTRRSLLEFAGQPDLVLPEQHRNVIDMFAKQSYSLPFGDNKAELFKNGYEFFPALLRDIAAAQSHIHIDIYIFEDDPLGKLVSDALIARSKKGVEVRVVYDDVGCWSVKKEFFERMREAGVEIEPFMPVRFPKFTSKANYRNHRKLIVIDGRIGYMGGMNIALRYVKGGQWKEERGKKEQMGWRDTMVRIEGRGVCTLQQAFLIDWYFVDRTLLSDRKYYPSTLNPQLSTLNPQLSTLNPQPSTLNPQPSTLNPQPSTILQTVTCGPASPYPEIMQGFLSILLSARQYVYIETPYFLPTTAILLALKMASATGVDVRLLVPLHSDAWLTQWASRSYLREVAEAGVKVYFHGAGFLHSKIMVADDSVSTCGSTNIDFRSFENNFEANTFFYGQDVAVRMRKMFLTDQQHSVSWSDMGSRRNPRFQVRLWESITRLLSPLL